MTERIAGGAEYVSLGEVIQAKERFFEKANKFAADLGGDPDIPSIEARGDVEVTWVVPDGYALAMHRGDEKSKASVWQRLGGSNRYPTARQQDYDRDNPLLVRALTANVNDTGVIQYTLRTQVDEAYVFSEVLLENTVSNENSINEYSFRAVRLDLG